ncbi:hypothetical protein BSU04_27475 [Caballeronia sordidicola]|uniref:Uncharacterized protein n=1 Tax=Caballeronia sordidicola TaxID=196367 RepID=A0A226WWU3_CABSO|nr:hypothetical protein BSU04_27475 [Caballeronia sordidicola]
MSGVAVVARDMHAVSRCELIFTAALVKCGGAVNAVGAYRSGVINS